MTLTAFVVAGDLQLHQVEQVIHSLVVVGLLDTRAKA